MSQVDRVHFFLIIFWVMILFISWYGIVVISIMPKYYRVMRSRVLLENSLFIDIKNFIYIKLNLLLYSNSKERKLLFSLYFCFILFSSVLMLISFLENLGYFMISDVSYNYIIDKDSSVNNDIIEDISSKAKELKENKDLIPKKKDIKISAGEFVLVTLGFFSYVYLLFKFFIGFRW